MTISIPSSEQNVRVDVFDASGEPEGSKKRGNLVASSFVATAELGQGNTSIALSKDEGGKAGTLQVSTKWQEKKAECENGAAIEGGLFEEVEVSLIRAKGLPKADTFGSSDPYVKVIWEGEEVHKTAVIKNNLNPEWENESVVLRVPYLEDDERMDEIEPLRLEVYDYDRIGKHDLLGVTTIPATTLVRPRRVRNDLELQGDTKKSGTLSVDVKTAGNAGMTAGTSNQVVLSAGKLGESLDVEVNILNAKDLAKADTFGKSDPFVEVRITLFLLNLFRLLTQISGGYVYI